MKFLSLMMILMLNLQFTMAGKLESARLKVQLESLSEKSIKLSMSSVNDEILVISQLISSYVVVCSQKCDLDMELNSADREQINIEKELVRLSPKSYLVIIKVRSRVQLTMVAGDGLRLGNIYSNSQIVEMRSPNAAELGRNPSSSSQISGVIHEIIQEEYYLHPPKDKKKKKKGIFKRIFS